jgi:uncharacterized membrane protein
MGPVQGGNAMAKEVVLAIFDDEAAADNAVDALKSWDQLDQEVRLNAIGVLVADENGHIKQHKLGRHDTGKGAGIGFILGLIAVALTPILGVGVAAWAVGGAVIGRLMHKHLGLSKDDLERIGAQIKGGKAAVGVMVETAQVVTVSAKLQELGGTPEAHTLEDVEQLNEAAADASAEIGETPTATVIAEPQAPPAVVA